MIHIQDLGRDDRLLKDTPNYTYITKHLLYLWNEL